LAASGIITPDSDGGELFVGFPEVKADGFMSLQSKGRIWSEASPFPQVWVALCPDYSALLCAASRINIKEQISRNGNKPT
jgi:hypothetical protein